MAIEGVSTPFITISSSASVSANPSVDLRYNSSCCMKKEVNREIKYANLAHRHDCDNKLCTSVA